MPDNFIGIDPGASGGLAVVHWDGQVEARHMPATERDVWDWLEGNAVEAFAVLEKVGGYLPGKRQPGSRMFNFGAGYGGLRMALVGNKIPYELIVPRVWQKALGIAPRKPNENDTHWKNRLKGVAQQLFPRMKVTLATADALLIAEYCRRKYGS